MEEEKNKKLELARSFYYKEDFKKAYEIYNELIEKYDDKEAKLCIAEMYFEGIGVNQNYIKAFKIFNELVEKYNDKDAKSYIAIMTEINEISEIIKTNAQKELTIPDENDYNDNKEDGITIGDNKYINDIPGIPITDKDREIKLLEYTDLALSEKEEEEYYKRECNSYFARIDTDIEYKGKKYYKRIYISKDN